MDMVDAVDIGMVDIFLGYFCNTLVTCDTQRENVGKTTFACYLHNMRHESGASLLKQWHVIKLCGTSRYFLPDAASGGVQLKSLSMISKICSGLTDS